MGHGHMGGWGMCGAEEGVEQGKVERKVEPMHANLAATGRDYFLERFLTEGCGSYVS